MAIRYRKVQNKNTVSNTYGKWYGRAVVMDVVTTRDLAKEIAHNSTVTYADILAVLAEMAVVMKGHLQNSQRVILDGIGSFRVGFKCRPANTSAEFDSTKITGYHIVYKAEADFNATGVNEKGNRTGVYIKRLLEGITAKEAPKNDVKDAAKAKQPEKADKAPGNHAADNGAHA